MLVDEDDIERLTPSKLQAMKAVLLEKIHFKHKTEEEVVQRTLGLFLRDSFLKQEQFSKLKEEFEMCLDDYELPDSDDDDLCSEIADTIYSETCLSSIKNESVESDFSYLNTFQKEQDSLKEVGSKIRGEANPDIIDYLTKLGSPQSELNHLCQYFGWKNSFKNTQASEGLFAVEVVVDFEFKGSIQMLRESATYQNKKMGRMFASFKMLKKIYLSFP